jgi:hypothetical protein
MNYSYIIDDDQESVLKKNQAMVDSFSELLYSFGNNYEEGLNLYWNIHPISFLEIDPQIKAALIA